MHRKFYVCMPIRDLTLSRLKRTIDHYWLTIHSEAWNRFPHYNDSRSKYKVFARFSPQTFPIEYCADKSQTFVKFDLIKWLAIYITKLVVIVFSRQCFIICYTTRYSDAVCRRIKIRTSRESHNTTLSVHVFTLFFHNAWRLWVIPSEYLSAFYLRNSHTLLRALYILAVLSNSCNTHFVGLDSTHKPNYFD